MVASIYSVWATSIIFAHTSIIFTNMSRHRSEVYVQQFDTFWNCVYPICLAFALINALAKQQASKRSTDKVSLKNGGNRQTASLISLTLPGATYPIRFAFALINALAKRQASKPIPANIFH